LDNHEIAQMQTPEDVLTVRALVQRYVQWLFDTYPQEYEDTASYYSPERLQAALDEIGPSYMLPNGHALIARRDGAAVGFILSRRIAPGTAEIRRLFVDPSARGQGIGGALVDAVLAEMAAAGHPVVRLDTAVFLTDAIALYRSRGFREIAAYAEVPAGAAKNALFMEWRQDPD
jgi:ribosomal protein S18 acetylase RimI-like enzyme